MSKPSFGPRAAEDLPQISQSVTLSKQARLLLSKVDSPPAYVDELLKNGLDIDALRVISYWLTSRQAVWWCSLCTWYGCGGSPSPKEDEALGAAVHWTLEPTPDHCQKADRSAHKARLRTAAGCAAKAACLAGSCRSHDDPLTGGKPLQAARVTSAGVLLACAAAKASGKRSCGRDLALLGLDVDQGKLPWGPG